MKRQLRQAITVAYGLWVIGLMVPTALGSWLVVAVLPGARSRWAYARVVIRTFALVIGVRVSSEGFVDSGSEPAVYVANHGSFLDAVVLIACFRTPVSFVAASEFSSKWFVGSLLRRMGVEFVHRDEPRKAAAEEIRHLVGRLRTGVPLVIFPEGSLGPEKGVRGFLPGAFYTAARAMVAVVPIGIAGSDAVLTPHTKLPKRASISVRLGQPIWPSGVRRRELEELSLRARSEVLELSGEHDLEVLR